MTILDKIIAYKKKEVALAKKRLPLDMARRKLSFNNFPLRKLVKTVRMMLVAEIKPKSPSAGVIRNKLNPAKLAKQFEAGGAAAISVLTDKKYFGGSFKNLSAAKKASSLPILRKDFICDPYQLYESKLQGADLVLLIVSVLKNRLRDFVKLALKLNLQPLIEVHNSSELKIVFKSVKPSQKVIIGVNNRNLKTFKTDLDVSLELVKMIPKEFIKISESGIFEINQLKKLKAAGFDGVLIGQGLAKNRKLFNYFK